MRGGGRVSGGLGKSGKIEKKLDSGFIDNFRCYVVGWRGFVGSHSGSSDMRRDSFRLIERLNVAGDAHD